MGISAIAGQGIAGRLSAFSKDSTPEDKGFGALVAADPSPSTSTTQAPSGKIAENLLTLLLPNDANLSALSTEVNEEFDDFLVRNGIPEAPSRVTYDTRGQIQFPKDYKYAEEFRKALEAEPEFERKLRTLNALSSHYVAIQDSIAFSEAYPAAKTKAEVDAVLSRFSYLFSGNRRSAQIALEFDGGKVSVTADGKAVEFTSA